ncbi:MAG TPA: response regulator transcription factor, partial [Blastocatellia bacterium]|nr:response regulator transcription factor [Blastocatellia bacterium]
QDLTAQPGQQAQDAPNRTIKVAIIEDHLKFRECLEFLLENTAGYKCAGSFRSMEEALEKISRDLPDVVLVDIGLPGMSGVDGVRILKERHPSLLMLMNTVYDDDERIFQALCAGASGYLLKKTPPARLLESLKEAMAGGAPMSPEVARRVLAIFREIRPPERADYKLTPHELRLLKLLTEGHSYKTAATQLGVSVKTISFHLQKIYEKLQVHSKSEAVSKALKNRLV